MVLLIGMKVQTSELVEIATKRRRRKKGRERERK
jgi:hypothetical protein